MGVTGDAVGDDPFDADTTLAGLVGELSSQGYTHQFLAVTDTELVCTGCDSQFEADRIVAVGLHRVERETDPDESSVVVWAACPTCHEGGVAVLGDGPDASDADRSMLNLFSDRDHNVDGRTHDS